MKTFLINCKLLISFIYLIPPKKNSANWWATKMWKILTGWLIASISTSSSFGSFQFHETVDICNNNIFGCHQLLCATRFLLNYCFDALGCLVLCIPAWLQIAPNSIFLYNSQCIVEIRKIVWIVWGAFPLSIQCLCLRMMLVGYTLCRTQRLWFLLLNKYVYKKYK